MNIRLVVLLLLIAGWIASVVYGDAKPCVTKERCPKGVTPPACCQPPPCEVYEQIRLKRAMQNIFANQGARDYLIKKTGGDNKEAAALMYQFVLKGAKNRSKFVRCEWKEIPPPPSFETNGECEIVANLPGGDQAMSHDRALKELNTCSEFIDAAYSHEQEHKDICFKTNSTARMNQGITSYAEEEIESYQQEIDKLKADLQAFWKACSPTIDAKLARKLAKLGVDVLKENSNQQKNSVTAAK